MSLLTRVVKAFAVVDDRAKEEAIRQQDAPPPLPKVIKSGAAAPRPPAAPQEELSSLIPQVIKNSVVSHSLPAGTLPRAPRAKQDFVDEVNRLRVEIAQSKAELRTLCRELDEAREEMDSARALLAEEEAGPDAAAESCQAAGRKTREDAEREARDLVEAARDEALHIAEEAKNNGYLEGFNEGFEQARREYQDENQPQADLLEDMVQRVSEYERKQVRENEQNLLELVLAVSEKVIHREISERPETIVDMLREVVEENRREELVKITISNDLLPVAAKCSKEVIDLLESMGANIAVGLSGDLGGDGLMAETSAGLTDLSVSTQLNNIAELLGG